jgi:glycosyltransferase involved in cell wall biosynthesis
MGPAAERAAATPDRKLRVLLLIKCLGYGGAERILVDVASQADRDHFEYEAAYVLASEDGLVSEMRSTGTMVHNLGSKGNWDLSWLAPLRRLLVDGRFDVVHAHLPYAAAFGRLVVRTLPPSQRPRFVYTEHSIWDKAATPVRWLNSVAVRHDDALVAVSDTVRDALPRSIKQGAEVVVHGVDLSQADGLVAARPRVRDEVRRELDLPTDSIVVLTVANLRAEKGYDVLLEAARIVLDRGVDAHFVSVGRGPLELELAASHQEMGLGERFKFLGPRGDVLRLMVASDIFVLPSRQEGLPVTLMEATSVGMAIVATAVGEVPRVITSDEDGLVIEPDDPEGLADAIERLVREPSLRAAFGDAARTLSARFDVSRATRQLESIYRDITKNRTQAPAGQKQTLPT